MGLIFVGLIPGANFAFQNSKNSFKQLTLTIYGLIFGRDYYRRGFGGGFFLLLFFAIFLFFFFLYLYFYFIHFFRGGGGLIIEILRHAWKFR